MRIFARVVRPVHHRARGKSSMVEPWVIGIQVGICALQIDGTLHNTIGTLTVARWSGHLTLEICSASLFPVVVAEDVVVVGLMGTFALRVMVHVVVLRNKRRSCSCKTIMDGISHFACRH